MNFKFVAGGSNEHAALSNAARYKVGFASFADHINAKCVSYIGVAAPTATNVQNAFVDSYNDGITMFGFTPGESQTISKAGILAYIACYGITGADPQKACLASAGNLALLMSAHPAWAKLAFATPSYGQFTLVDEIYVLWNACVAVTAQLSGSAQNAACQAIQTFLTANGFWF